MSLARPQETSLSVAEVLSLPAFAGAEVVAGASGVNRRVANVNVMEVPDIIPWVKKGDMLITTGFVLKDDADAQKNLIPQLDARGAAALAIKPRRYLGCLPPAMIEAADELGFPLIALPLEANFSDLLSAVLAQIVNRQAFFVQHALEVHQRFTDLILKGARLPEIATDLARVIRAFVSLVDTLNLRHAVYPSEAATEQERAALTFLQARAAERLRWGGPAGRSTTPKREEVQVGDGWCELVELPVVVEGKRYGSVQALAVGRHFASWEIMDLERVCSIVALEILHQHAVQQVEYRYRAEFLNQLLHSDHLLEKDWVERAKIFGWDLTKRYVALLIKLAPRDAKESHRAGREKTRQAIKTQAITLVDSFVRAENVEHLLVGHESGVLLFLHAPQDDTGWLRSVIRRLRERLAQWEVTVGIGGPNPGVAGLKRSYEEARAALQIGEEVYGAGSDIWYNQLGVYSLLLRRATLQEQRAFAESLLQPLVMHDRAHQTDTLFRTLDVYLDTGGNARQTAAALYTHYNTVFYRLNRIRELTNLDPRDPEQRITLQVALKLYKLFNGQL